jgi:hypothetical protein
MAVYRWFLAPPFPSTGKGRDRGAREPIKPITPTSVLPRQGEGSRALSPSATSYKSATRATPSPIFEEVEMRSKQYRPVLSRPWESTAYA